MEVRFLTSPEEISRRWPELQPLLAPVVADAAHGEYTLDDLFDLARAGSLTVGVCETAGRPLMAMAFEFRHYPRKLAINVVALGGCELKEVAGRYFDKFREYAALAGADDIEAMCSRPMARMLKGLGFAATYECVRLKV